MAKTEVYSWRVTTASKATLEAAARREGVTVSSLLDRITKEWIESAFAADADDDEQSRLKAVVLRTVGTIDGGNARRSEQAKIAVRKRLRLRHGR